MSKLRVDDCSSARSVRATAVVPRSRLFRRSFPSRRTPQSRRPFDVPKTVIRVFARTLLRFFSTAVKSRQVWISFPSSRSPFSKRQHKKLRVQDAWSLNSSSGEEIQKRRVSTCDQVSGTVSLAFFCLSLSCPHAAKNSARTVELGPCLRPVV